jgi:hypothetical protein
MDIQTVQAVSNYVSNYMIKAPIELFGCDVPFKTDTDIGADWGNMEPFNRETGNMELEEENRIKIIPYTEWIESVYHYDIYERPWYKGLVTI